ncbi:hypothetical protein MPSI1_003787 [Malassezia psittaci]|uniref:BD-FAE-like domain-containing protein n=1 Tax=Malassezia psittaci TaxID=1821823 RepID=A0AAF0FCY7_9BASI|nr:hypothetical protein MPSI1_003787 [Malassezia psittaci]
MTDGQKCLNLEYGCADEGRQTLDLFFPTSTPTSPPKLLVFVHGGAWRTGSKDEFYDMAHALVTRSELAVALIEYRLSTSDAPNVKHPDHVQDVFDALQYLVRNEKALPYQTTHMVIVGHSVGAWMALAAVMEPTIHTQDQNQAASMPFLAPSIRSAIQKVVLVDPILDLDALLLEYPDYEGFVSNAFPSSDAETRMYDAVSVSSWTWTKQTQGRVRIVLMHSCDDELLSYAQVVVALKRFSVLCSSDDAGHDVQIPQPSSHACNSLAYWYRGKTQTESVSAHFQSDSMRVPMEIQVDWHSLSVGETKSIGANTDTGTL